MLPYDDIYFLVIVMKSAVHSPNFDGSEPYENQPLATHNGMQQPLTYYFHPFKMSGGRTNQPIVSVNGSAFMGLTQPLEVIQRLSEMTTTADNIVSMYVTDFTGLNTTSSSDNSLAFTDEVEWATIEDGTYSITTLCVKGIPIIPQRNMI